MMTQVRSLSLVLVLIAVATPLAWAQPHHHHDVVIGRTAQLLLKVETPHEPSELEPTAPGFPIAGWSGDAPGFEALEDDEPGEDFYKLQPGAQIELEVLALRDGLRMFNNAQQELLVGDKWLLGDHELHLHGLWVIDAQVNPDPVANPARGHFLVRDLGTTGYGPSAPFELAFIPEPASLALLLLLGAARSRRQG